MANKKTGAKARALGQLIVYAAMGAAFVALRPTNGQAFPALSPINNRGAYTLSDTEWDVLQDYQQQCYEVTIGQRTSTEFEVNVGKIVGKTSWTQDDGDMTMVQESVQDQVANTMRRVKAVLRCERPSLTAWERDDGLSRAIVDWEWDVHSDGSWVMTAPSAEFHVPVAPFCETGREHEVSAQGVRAIRASVEDAQEIADRYKDEEPVQRIRDYCKAISELSGYDYEARGNYARYNLSWSLISVFDGDPSTKSVCVAYSRALKLLVNLSGKDDVPCHYIEGDYKIGKVSGGHAWNIVGIDGRNYIVDLTNDWNAPGTMILTVGDGSVGAGYTVPLLDKGLYITYDQETLEIYQDAVLTITGTPLPTPDAPVAPATPIASNEASGTENTEEDEEWIDLTPPQEDEQEEDWTLNLPVTTKQDILDGLIVEQEREEEASLPSWLAPSVIAAIALALFAGLFVLRQVRRKEARCLARYKERIETHGAA